VSCHLLNFSQSLRQSTNLKDEKREKKLSIQGLPRRKDDKNAFVLRIRIIMIRRNEFKFRR